MKKVFFNSSDKYNWDLYESDLSYDYDKFVGYDQWSGKKVADERINFLQKEYEKNNSSLKINMLEAMMIVEQFGEEIKLDITGVYRIKKINLDNFISNLNYTQDMIKLIASLRDEMEFSIENYEIDAKQIFYIMKNAKSLGLNNFNCNSQMFLFAKNNNNKIIDAEINSDTINESSEIILATENFTEINNKVIVLN